MAKLPAYIDGQPISRFRRNRRRMTLRSAKIKQHLPAATRLELAKWLASQYPGAKVWYTTHGPIKEHTGNADK